MGRGGNVENKQTKNSKPQTFPYNAESQCYSYISLPLLHSKTAIIEKKSMYFIISIKLIMGYSIGQLIYSFNFIYPF